MSTTTSSTIMEDDFNLFTSIRYDPVLLQVPARKLTYAGWNWVNTSPFYLLDYHRDRMLRAATHWGWDAAVKALEGDFGVARLADITMHSIGDDQQFPLRVRISITKDGELSISSGPAPDTTLANLFPEHLPPPKEARSDRLRGNIPSKIPTYEVLVDSPQTSRSEFTHFKTTKRAAYDGARQRAKINPADLKEVLIVNRANGAVMEGSISTPYFWRGGSWVTPPVSKEYSLEEGCGGQNGTSRRWALERDLAVEGTILADSLVDGEECWLSNGHPLTTSRQFSHTSINKPLRFVTMATSESALTAMLKMFEQQEKLRGELGLQKIKANLNSKYQRHGTKSYVSAMERFGFQPTKPGPYFQKFTKADDATPGRAAPGVKPGHVWEGTLKKVKDDDKPGEVTAHDVQNDTEYLCEVSIGNEPQKVMLDFDTGSADLWVNPKSFDPKKSSTFKLAEAKTWQIQYGDGSSASGIVGTDLLTVGGLVIKDQAIEVATDMSAEFAKETTMDGLLGLAFGKINTIQSNGEPDPQPTVVENMISQEDIPKNASLFTSALYSSRDPTEQSFYTFGWIDQDLVKESGEDIHWTNVNANDGFWMFKSEKASVNDKVISLVGNNAIADTGTTLALVSDVVCEALYAQIPGAEYSEQYQGYTIPKDISVEDLPELSIAVGGQHFKVQKHDLLFAMADDKVWYGGVQSRGENPFDILGDSFLKSIYAIWDLGHKRFGAVPKLEKVVSNGASPKLKSVGDLAVHDAVLN
ncbi:acid protease [Parathielavia appendiculata]|uniref:Acid protease n=1 Tax=Parathielavia appendiculata TaxID=2587402 RepID=A0AAN6TVF4_9PEZI|nr:acid protease [Parathielavia appendiculata]